MDSAQSKEPNRSPTIPLALKGAGIYLLLGVFWITLSDNALDYLVTDPTRLTFYQSLKGWAYVAITALLAYLLLHRLASERVRLQDTTERLHRVIKAANVGLWEWDLRTNQVRYSPEWKRQIGFQEHEISNSFEEWNKRVHPDDLQRALHSVQAFLHEPRPEYQNQFRFRHRDGSYRWILVQASLTYDATGRPSHMLGSHVDVTDLKQAEAEIRMLNADLEIRVAERTRELESINRELEAFSYSVSHDLKAPLRGIDGYSRLLLDEHATQLDAEGRLFLSKIRQGAARMDRLIEDLLAYSRMERCTLESSSVELGVLIRTLVEERTADIEAAQGELHLLLPPITLHTDRKGLVLVLRNLLDNALKFHKPGVAPVIEIGGKTEPGRVRLWVRDNGIGFDMRFHERIFEIFQRLQRIDEYSGTGIGLAIVHKVVERMNGRVWAESALGAGATFYLELPQ